MGELTEACVELARLEKQEQEVIEQLYNVRTAIRAQRTKLDELIRGIHAPIDRLPNELLLRIFELSIHASILAFPSCDVHRHRKRDLAGVSRHWRDLILHFPRFWTTIRPSPTWGKSFVKAHVTRSSGSPLDIEICAQDVTQTFSASVGILVDCAQRWRSLIIQDDVYDSVLSILLKHMRHSVFPSLTHVSVQCVPSYLRGSFTRFYSERCPHLQHLDLGTGFIPSLDSMASPGLTSLAFGFGKGDPSPILQHISLQKLTTLSLSGFCGHVILDQNSLHLPLLKSFICKLSCAKMLIRAIVAPDLTHFTYRSRDREWDYGTESVYSSFPAVRHVDLDRDMMISVLQRGNISNPGYWPNLEREEKHATAKVAGQVYVGIISTLYEALHKRCILEWENVRLRSHIVFSGIADESPWFEVPMVHPGFIDHIGKAFVTWRVRSNAKVPCRCVYGDYNGSEDSFDESDVQDDDY
ncbi:hypothetical protein SCLCIDRAFT_27443 [Scleroderma citrinum Foug A]|uniref:Uncharacterized protein n=1 Tax=Scleroderma citrinum Foug A TaxID=1036808 RepID=A0A0C3DF51_9AGAM|nr:hypothetical protein SCLCIDRAFT_27443 [Scleroderma citrinum Foug A]